MQLFFFSNSINFSYNHNLINGTLLGDLNKWYFYCDSLIFKQQFPEGVFCYKTRLSDNNVDMLNLAEAILNEIDKIVATHFPYSISS